MVEIKTPGEIAAMRASGRVVARILATVRAEAKAGMRLTELDQMARTVLAEAGATSPFLGYRPSFASVPYPAAICTSVNDAALHGIPDRYRLTDGDLVSVDCGAVLDGWAADAAISFTIGPARPADAQLIATTEAALRAGIAAAQPGSRIGDISAAIGAVGRAGGYGICTDFGGHGVGRAMHEDPHIPNEGRAAAAAAAPRAWSSRSSRGSWPAARTSTTSTTTAGPSAAATAAARPTPSTPSPSPPTAPRS